MTRLSFHFPSIRTSHISHLKLLSYILIFLMCTGCAGSSNRNRGTVSIADLRAQLQPLRRIGTYAGFDLKTDVLYMGNDSIERWLRLNQGAHKIQLSAMLGNLQGKAMQTDRARNFGFGLGR